MMLLLQQSVAFQTVVAIIGQGPPLNAVPNSVMVTLLQQASVTVGGSKIKGVPQATVLFGAQLSSGGVVSTTVTT